MLKEIFAFCVVPVFLKHNFGLSNLCFFSAMIQTMMKEGKIVPSEVVVKLLQQAMLTSGNNKFLIDGFPRNEENRLTFESVVMLSLTIYILIVSAKLLVACFHSVLFCSSILFVMYLCIHVTDEN